MILRNVVLKWDIKEKKTKAMKGSNINPLIISYLGQVSKARC